MQRVCPVCKIEVVIPSDIEFMTPAVAVLHRDQTWCSDIDSYGYFMCPNLHRISVIRKNACNGCNSKQRFEIKVYLPFRALDNCYIEYGSKEQFVHVNGRTYDLYSTGLSYWKSPLAHHVESLMMAQKLHPPQIKKEIEAWLICSKRMKLPKDVRHSICKYLVMYPHYLPPSPLPPQTQSVVYFEVYFILGLSVIMAFLLAKYGDIRFLF